MLADGPRSGESSASVWIFEYFDLKGTRFHAGPLLEWVNQRAKVTTPSPLVADQSRAAEHTVSPNEAC